MRIFLLGFENSSIYDETTAYQLAEEGSFIFKKGLSKKDNYSRDDILIRYGNFSYSSYDRFFGKVINKAVSIFQNIDKLNTHLKLFRAGLRVPRIFFSKEQIKESDYPILKRNIKHSRANDIVIVDNPKDIEKGDFYTQLIPSNEEYRLLIMFNQCCRISKKEPIEPESDIIRSSSTGWGLKDIFKMNIKALNEAIPLCIKALNLLELDFGACDVVIEKNTNLPYLLEVNTCPRLNRYGRQVFIKEIYDYLKLNKEGISLGKVIDWEYKDIIPIKYRKGLRKKPSREDFGL